jgi:spore maturation protein CgeB
MAALIGEPSRALPEIDFALGGRDFRGEVGSARLLGDVPFPAFPRAISAARINLCITRRSHASVYASSSCRPFELAAAGAAVVANPYDGIERWFEPGSELIVVGDAGEAVAAYQDLLDDPGQAEELGRRARERVLDEHTYRHRARRLLDLLELGVGAHVD